MMILISSLIFKLVKINLKLIQPYLSIQLITIGEAEAMGHHGNPGLYITISMVTKYPIYLILIHIIIGIIHYLENLFLLNQVTIM
jgi:hypothetical protein